MTTTAGLRPAPSGRARYADGVSDPLGNVTIFPDSGTRYMSTIYSDDWMRAKGFL
jgi:hypothetical protein